MFLLYYIHSDANQPLLMNILIYRAMINATPEELLESLQENLDSLKHNADIFFLVINGVIIYRKYLFTL